MIRRLAGLSLALAMGATVLHAQDTIDPKTGKKRGPMEVLRDRDRPGKTSRTSPSPSPSPNTNPSRVITVIRDRDRDRDRDRVRDRVRHRDHDRDDDRDSFRGDGRPPGWSKGKKTGWGNCDVPPGQAKKYGCHPNGPSHHHSKRH
jgi:hypothetical protein